MPAKYLLGIELPFGYFPTHPNGSQSSVVYLEETSVSASFSISGSDEVYHDKYTQLISSKNIFGEYGYDGSGQTVVVIDTGIELNHSFFGKDENGTVSQIESYLKRISQMKMTTLPTIKMATERM